jgi:hypothetical protein
MQARDAARKREGWCRAGRRRDQKIDGYLSGGRRLLSQRGPVRGGRAVDALDETRR